MNGIITTATACIPKILWQNSTIPDFHSSANFAPATITVPNEDGYTFFAIVHIGATDYPTTGNEGPFSGMKTDFVYANTFDETIEQHGARLDFCSGTTNQKGTRVVYIKGKWVDGVYEGLEFQVEKGEWHTSTINMICYPIYIIGLA